MDHSEAGTSDDQTRNDSTQTISSTVQVDPSSDVTEPLSDVNMPPFEAGVDSSTVVKKVTFEDMPLLERQSNETVRYNSPVHPVRKQYVEKDQAFHTKDVKDPSVGPGQAGLFNLGNTCFMNSGLQCVFSNSHLVRYFLTQYHLTKSNESTLTGVFTRLLYKVWSSQYSVIHPLDFKQTLGLYHPQFHDYRQHDCQEFLALLLDTLHEQLNSSASGGPRPHPGGFQNFAAASCSSTYEPIYSASCPSPSRQPDSFAESSYTANNKVSSATGLRSQVKRAGGSINIQFNREADSEISSGVACIDGIRNIENPMDMKAFSPSALIQSQTPPNDDSNLSCQSSDSEQSVGLSRLKLKDQNKDRETQVTSSTDLELVARSGVNNSGINLSTISASDSHLQYSAESSKSVHSPGIVDASQNAMQKRSAEAEMTNVDKDPEVSSSQEESLAIIDSVASGDIFSTSPREAMGLPVESIDAQGCVSVLNNAAPRPRLPTLEDLYAKDTKTLNTNVLAVEYMDEDIQMDSDKFAKPDNINRPQEGPENVHMNELALQVESKANKPRQVKDTNIQAENLKKCRVLKNNAQSQSFEGDFDDTLSINNVKRMKFEGTAKNIKRQALHKVNREKFLFHKSDTAVLGSDGDSCSSEETPDENLVEMADEGQSSVSRDSPVDVPTDPVENLTHENIAAANEAWEDYLEKNRSIIIDTFQGQFRSTVICSECQHVSVTHEPFMYLSIPLPHAMERQISVILVSCDGPPTRYLFTMHKNDSVWKLKKELLAAAGFDTADVILTEVLDCHISRILDDNVMLCYVNDSTREIYGFRMLAAPPLPLVEDSERGTTLDSIDQTPVVKSSSLNTFSGDVFQASSTVTTATYSAAEIPQQDIFSNMGMFNGKMSERDNLADADTTVGTSKSVLIPSFSLDVDLEEPMSTMLETESDTCNDSTPDNGTPTTESQGHQSADLTLEQASTSHCITQDEIQPSLPPRLNTPELDLTGAHSWEDEPVASTSQFSSDFLVGNWSMEMEVNVSPPEPPHPQQWRSCAICLEDMVDTDLMVHPSCGGTLCQSCLDMSFKHYGDVAFTCPVCTTPVNPTSGFLPLSVQSSRSSNSRLLAVPVACRTECEEEGLRLFSHPNVVYLYSRMKGQEVYEMIDRLLPFACTYTISLTDGQGLHCSRCVYTARCNGCIVLREGEITLQPGDHLTVTVTDTCRPEAPPILNHKSMEKLRPKDPITIYDCFTAFTESEILDEHNPWYCPQCAQNQRAKKTMTVWRYPDTLIIHLKRFVFHELSSTKVDNKVVFPLDNLDLSEFLSGPRTKELYYDLHGIVCHFGGANAGHYTAYTKHPLQDRWFYYNDETVSERAPRDDDHSTGYVLFYQRQGTDIKFSPLTELKPPESAEEPCSSTQGESVPLTEQPQPSSMHEGGLECRKSPVDAENLASILQNLKEQKDEATESVEPDSTFDFYI